MHQGFRKELWTKLVEVLIIDEISMLSGEWLDNLERMLRELTHYYGRGEFQKYLRMPMKDIPAFGGIHGTEALRGAPEAAGALFGAMRPRHRQAGPDDQDGRHVTSVGAVLQR
jgi:hypothetical protein